MRAVLKAVFKYAVLVFLCLLFIELGFGSLDNCSTAAEKMEVMSSLTLAGVFFGIAGCIAITLGHVIIDP